VVYRIETRATLSYSVNSDILLSGKELPQTRKFESLLRHQKHSNIIDSKESHILRLPAMTHLERKLELRLTRLSEALADADEQELVSAFKQMRRGRRQGETDPLPRARFPDIMT
jgi:hypothetical protein